MNKEFISTICVVKKEDSYLLCKREDNGLWVLPGGGLEAGETPEEAAKRELFEETGIKAKFLKFRGEWIFNIFGKYKIVAVFEASKISGKLTTSWESPEVKFMDRDEVQQKIPLYTRVLIDKIINTKQQFVLKAGPFESWVIGRYLYGILKRKLRKINPTSCRGKR